MTTYQVPCECGAYHDYRAQRCRACDSALRLAVRVEPSIESMRPRFEAKVDRSGGPEACHPWLAARNRKGYGSFNGRRYGNNAPRIALALDGRPVGPGLMACHTCDNPPCVNPRHLYVGTAAENARDMIQRGRASHHGFHGETHPMAKLTFEAVADIRYRLFVGQTQRSIASIFGVSKSQISSIARGARWAA